MKTRKILRTLNAGDEIKVTCTDPLAAIDIPNLIRETGDRLIEQYVDGKRMIFRIAKASGAH
ncbi:sulfurtransferase TusA family protein [Microvirga sp. 2MCAF38]|uniref:sulfurtransferase TusA family protein n=1 Tax=Microvirga sp. 2MCAF38 TaxID=3232989 RepID=UPI003F9496AD